MNKPNLSQATVLCQSPGESLKRRSFEPAAYLSESEILKLIRKLEENQAGQRTNIGQRGEISTAFSEYEQRVCSS